MEIPQTHDGFSLSKKEMDDVTIGKPNHLNLICPNCFLLIAPKGTCTKIHKNVSVIIIGGTAFYSFQVGLILNAIDANDLLDKYWEATDITNFHNLQIHSFWGEIKYLCCP